MSDTISVFFKVKSSKNTNNFMVRLVGEILEDVFSGFERFGSVTIWIDEREDKIFFSKEEKMVKPNGELTARPLRSKHS